jgi:hypothetical protein
MCRNVRSIEWHQKTYHKISWDYPFKWLQIELLQGQVKDGFFVEAGADDFETDTNTLYFEVIVYTKNMIVILYILKYTFRWNTAGRGCLLSLTQPSILSGKQNLLNLKWRHFNTAFVLRFVKQRKAWGAGTCLGTQYKPHTANFSQKAVEVQKLNLLLISIGEYR